MTRLHDLADKMDATRMSGTSKAAAIAAELDAMVDDGARESARVRQSESAPVTEGEFCEGCGWPKINHVVMAECRLVHAPAPEVTT